jgi:enoyl-CoA hydratase/carnithine racemase
MSLNSYTTLLFESGSDGVATVTLNRPDRLNAFNSTMLKEFQILWQHIGARGDIRAIVLRAAGERAFCTGWDVKEPLFDDGTGPFDMLDPSHYLGPKTNRIWKPVICAVHGMLAGGAFYFVNESDVVICSEEAQFFDPHTSFGMVAACEPVGLMGRLPRGEIMRMVLMGNDERMSAATALRLGLVSEITPRAALWERAHEIARLVAAKPGVATQGTVRAMWESRDLPHTQAAVNALKYCQLGNDLGMAEVDRASAPKARYSVR